MTSEKDQINKFMPVIIQQDVIPNQIFDHTILSSIRIRNERITKSLE